MSRTINRPASATVAGLSRGCTALINRFSLVDISPSRCLYFSLFATSGFDRRSKPQCRLHLGAIQHTLSCCFRHCSSQTEISYDVSASRLQHDGVSCRLANGEGLF